MRKKFRLLVAGRYGELTIFLAVSPAKAGLKTARAHFYLCELGLSSKKVEFNLIKRERALACYSRLCGADVVETGILQERFASLENLIERVSRLSMADSKQSASIYI